jgi:hypothetical protein
VSRAPFSLECLDFRVCELLRSEIPPSTQAALIAKRKVTSFADVALIWGNVAGPRTKNLSSGDAVWFISWIVRGVVAPVGI